MKILDIITEAPLTDYQPLGDFERGRGGFRHAVDKRLVTNPVSVGKVHKFFQNSPYDIRIFPVQVRGGGRWLETGEVTPEKLVEIVGKDNAQRILAGQGPDNITIVFTNNTGSERIPLTPWMMAHRMDHALRKRSGYKLDQAWQNASRHFWRHFDLILNDYYQLKDLKPEYKLIVTKAMIDAIGTMRSTRRSMITNPQEFIHEIFAQYINTGEIKFNPAPATLLSRQQAWGRSHHIRSINKLSQQEASSALETLSYDMELMFNDVMSNALGRIYVM